MPSAIAVHPARLLARLGVSDWPALVVIGATVTLQYVFLFRLWEGYLLRHAGDVIHSNVVIFGVVASLIGSAAIATWSLHRWLRGLSAARRLERPAAHPSFNSIRDALSDLAGRSCLEGPPALLYNPKNAYALEVRENGARGAVVVGLEQRKRQIVNPEGFAAQLGHEISHLELAQTRFEICFRQIVILHFQILGWFIAIFLLMLAFIDRRGIGSRPTFGGFAANFDITLFAQLLPQFAVLLLSAAVVYVYSYFFVVRREHMHDVRGSQLAGTEALADSIFASVVSRDIFDRVLVAVKTFFKLHPNPERRSAVVRNRDILLVSALLYPAIVSALQPLTLLLTAGWRDYFGIEGTTWNVGLTIASGILLFGLLRADIVRLGAGILLQPRKYCLLVPLYAVMAGVATQLPRLVLEVIFSWRRGYTWTTMAERFWDGFLTGGFRIALMVSAILALLATLSAVRIAAVGERMSMPARFVDATATGAAVIGGFVIASLSVTAFQLSVALLCAVLAMLYVAGFALLLRCRVCGRRRFSAVLLKTRCRCGGEHIPLLRRWTSEAYRSLARDLS
jgi:Zn-dependent protease with chaperone function